MNSMGYPTKAERLKKIALRKREKLMVGYEATVEAKRKKEAAAEVMVKKMTKKIWEETILPQLLQYMLTTSKLYEKNIDHWVVDVATKNLIHFKLSGTPNHYGMFAPDRLYDTIPGRQIIVPEIQHRYLIDLCLDFFRENGYWVYYSFNKKPIRMNITLKHPEKIKHDTLLQIYNNLEEPSKPIDEEVYKSCWKGYAKSKRNTILNFIHQAAKEGIGGVNIIYHKESDDITIDTSGSTLTGSYVKVVTLDLSQELLYTDINHPKTKLIDCVLEYWMNWLKNNNGFEVNMLPISYHKDTKHTGFQVLIYNSEDIKK